MSTCLHCGTTIRVGTKVVVVQDGLVHSGCLTGYDFEQRGLRYKCPQCNATGKMDDPSGTTRKVEVPLGHNEAAACALSGCMGCRMCWERIKFVDVPVKVECSLCGGVGRLKSEPIPVKAVVGYRLGS